MQVLKKMIRKPNKILEQLNNRVAELKFVEKNDVKLGFIGKNRITGYQFTNFALKTTNVADCCCMIAGGIPVMVTCISGNKTATFQRYQRVESFFTNPVNSLNDLGIVN